MQLHELCMGCMRERGNSKKCPYCGYVEGTPPDLPQQLNPRTIINEKYLIGKVLGHGGFGITYLGWDKILNRKVAIKEYLPGDFATRALGQKTVSAYTGEKKQQFEYGLEKFLEEAKMLAKFGDHPNIVSIYDFFKYNGTAYIIMNYIEGITLKSFIEKQDGKISFENSLAIMLPVMGALEVVHSANILHRDISPDNIYIQNSGQVKVLDFGAARQALGNSKSLSVILKPGYAPEEQYRSKGNQGPWTDIYAVASTIYKTITGQTPPESLERLVEDELKKPSELGVQIPENSEKALMKAMEIKSDNRFQTMKEFREAITNDVELGSEIQMAIVDSFRVNDRIIESANTADIPKNSQTANTPKNTPGQSVDDPGLQSTILLDQKKDNIKEMKQNQPKKKTSFKKKAKRFFILTGIIVILFFTLSFLFWQKYGDKAMSFINKDNSNPKNKTDSAQTLSPSLTTAPSPAVNTLTITPGTSTDSNSKSVDIGNGISTNWFVTLNTEQKMGLLNEDKAVYGIVDVPQDGYIRIDMKHNNLTNDSIFWRIDLLDINSNKIVSMDSAGTEVHNVTPNIGLTQGRYVLKIDHASYSPEEFIIMLGYEAKDDFEKESNNTVQSANTILFGKEYVGSILRNNDEDYYKITMDKPGGIKIDFKHDNFTKDNTYWKIELLDVNSNYITGFNSRGTDIDLETWWVGIPQGEFYIHVSDYEWHWGNYKIMVNLDDKNSFEMENNDTIASSNQLALNTPIFGSIQKNNDVDFYKLSIAEKSTVRINFKHDNFTKDTTYWQVYLLDESSNVISDFSSKGTDVSLTTAPISLNTGTYYIQVKQYNLHNGNYNLQVVKN